MTELEELQYRHDQAVRHIAELKGVIDTLRKREDEWLECMEFKRALVEFIGEALDKRREDREEWLDSLRSRRDED